MYLYVDSWHIGRIQPGYFDSLGVTQRPHKTGQVRFDVETVRSAVLRKLLMKPSADSQFLGSSMQRHYYMSRH
jgi:hypothetical protein